MPAKTHWDRAIVGSADPRRARERVEQLLRAPEGSFLAKASLPLCRIICGVLAGSEVLGEQLVANPAWVKESLDPDRLKAPRRKEGFRRDVTAWRAGAGAAAGGDGELAWLRRYKQRELMRIAARDLAGLGDAREITRELSDLADVCLESVFRVVWARLTERHGTPWHQDAQGRWRPTPSCVLGMGKLGGQELNYSSDVDVLFLYAEEGWMFRAPPSARAPRPETAPGAHVFFCRMAETFVSEVGRFTAEGGLYRIDLRLRPEGPTGPVARSMEGYENYYSQWGQAWERMMLIKARCVAGDEGLAAEFLEMVQPFRYPRYLAEGSLREVALMKQRIETEVVRAGELTRNVKLGRGGIREIEFVAQTFQVLRGGREPFLQGSQTLPVLEKLVQYEHLSSAEAKRLAQAYLFLRAVEHRLQMERNLQTHTVPADAASQARLAALMGFDEPATFLTALSGHMAAVRTSYDSLVHFKDLAPAGDLPMSNVAGWTDRLRNHRFRDPERAHRLVRGFVEGPGFGHVSSRTNQVGLTLVGKLLKLCALPDAGAGPARVLSDPDRVLARLDTFVKAYGSRSMLYDTWNGNPTLFELVIRVFDCSEHLAEILIRTPDLLEEIVMSGHLRRSKTSAQILADLRHGSADADQHSWIRRYQEAEVLRIACRDLLGWIETGQTQAELTALADAMIEYALETVSARMRFRKPPLAVIGLGRLGGRELSFGSDLDVLLVAEDGTRDLPGLQKLAVNFIDLLSSRTAHGRVFEVDLRLRPDGEKGLLVNVEAGYSDYYLRRAMLWEIQSLTRARVVAGDSRVGASFMKLVTELTDLSSGRSPAQAASGDWIAEVVKMRRRIASERTPAGKQALAIKTGDGGLMDGEFLAQMGAMAGGWHEPNTPLALRRVLQGRDGIGTPGAGVLQGFTELRRIEGVLRRWSFEGEDLLPDDIEAMTRVAVRCGFPSAAAFTAHVAECRRKLAEGAQAEIAHLRDPEAGAREVKRHLPRVSKARPKAAAPAKPGIKKRR